MQFISIKLCKYKRLSLNHIDYIEITPQNKIQLLLGSNGSGKSSILSQITPLPGNHQDYLKDGYKIIEIVHNNSHYELKSIFASTGNTYEFIKNGVNINDGLTATTFKELVRQEFNITQDVQDVLVGYTTFTGMSVAERRNWFTKISDADYTYAIRYFAKLKEQHRDMVGAIKLQQSRLVQENEKLLTPEQEDRYRHEIDILNDYLTNLLDQKIPIKVSKDTLLNETKDIENNLVEFTEDFRQFYRLFNNHEGFKDPSEIDSKIIELKSEVLSLETDISNTVKQIEEQEIVLQTIKDSNISNLTDIDKTIDEHISSIATLKSQDRLGLNFEDPDKALNSLSSVSDTLNYISTELVENKDKSFNRDSFNIALERQKDLSNNLTEIEGKLNALQNKRKELEHFKEHNEIQCPKCRHTWHQGFEEFQYKITLEAIATVTIQKNELIEVIDKQTKHIDIMRSYLETYRSYVTIVRSWSILQPLWDHVSNNNILFEDPRRLSQIVQVLQGDLQIAIRIKIVEKQLNDALSVKKSLHDLEESSVASFVSHSELLHERLYNFNTQLQVTKQNILKLTSYKDAIAKMDVLTASIKMGAGTIQSKSEDLVAAYKMQAVNEAIELVRMELFNREQLISKVDIQHAVVMNIQLQITELSERSQLLKIALDELSPSQGLIAKGLTGFINHFVGQVNMFIKNIWLYPMELIAIVPDEDDSVELDYKFSVMINDEPTNIVPDISKGSAGMREIINLAFKVVSMMFLGLDKAPLTLDEFGANLDTAHRHSAQYAITNLINSSEFSQIFMVSHYENAYGSLKNCDICVLHDANVQMPTDMVYNKHVKII